MADLRKVTLPPPPNGAKCQIFETPPKKGPLKNV